MKTAEEQLAEEAAALEDQIDGKAKEVRDQASKQGLSEEEVREKVERVRKEEKDKLYPQIEEVKTALKEVQATLRAEREEKEKIKREAAEKAEAERQAKMSETDKTKEVLIRLEEQLNEERAERVRFEQRLAESQRQDELRRYREQVLRAAGDEIIPDLVRGTSETEIDESVKLAKARYEEYMEKIKEQVSRKVKRTLGHTTNPDIEALEEEELEQTLAEVDKDKYMKDPVYREKVKNELASAYSKAMGRR